MQPNMSEYNEFYSIKKFIFIGSAYQQMLGTAMGTKQHVPTGIPQTKDLQTNLSYTH